MLEAGTYIAEPKHQDSAHRVCKHPHPKDIGMPATDREIPQEISERKALTQTPRTVVPPNPLLPILVVPPLLPLLIEPDDVQADGVNDDRLDKGDDVDIPVELRAAGEARIGIGTEAGGEKWADDIAGEGVEGGGEEDLVRVEGERLEGESVGVGFYERDEEGWWWDGEGVEHSRRGELEYE